VPLGVGVLGTHELAESHVRLGHRFALHFMDWLVLGWLHGQDSVHVLFVLGNALEYVGVFLKHVNRVIADLGVLWGQRRARWQVGRLDGGLCQRVGVHGASLPGALAQDAAILRQIADPFAIAGENRL